MQIPIVRGNFEGRKGRPIIKYSHSAMSCAKTAEPFEMSYGLWARTGPMNGVRIPPWEGAIFEGVEGRPIINYRNAVSCAKRLN